MKIDIIQFSSAFTATQLVLYLG